MVALALLLRLLAVVSAAVEPIIFVPGLGGSVLEGNIFDKTPFRDCNTNSSGWFTLWFSEIQTLLRTECFLDNIELHLDDDGHVIDAPGINIRPKDFGGMNGVRFANSGSNDPVPAPYLDTFTRALVAIGYEVDVSLRAATYDFRTAGDTRAVVVQFAALKDLIEQTYTINNKAPVHIISHSLGCPFVNHFLIEAALVWKNTYIASSVSLSGVYAGTPVAMQALIAGPVYPHIPQQLPAIVAPAIRTFPCILWMFPSDDAQKSVWNNDVFYETDAKNYTYSDMQEIIHDLNATVLMKEWDQVEKVRYSGLKAPGVPVLCMYVNDTRTAYTIKAKSISDMNAKVIKSTMGDGTVNLRSLQVCQSWKQRDVIKANEYQMGGSLAAHTDIIKFSPVIKDIIAWVTNPLLRSQPGI